MGRSVTVLMNVGAVGWKALRRATRVGMRTRPATTALVLSDVPAFGGSLRTLPSYTPLKKDLRDHARWRQFDHHFVKEEKRRKNI